MNEMERILMETMHERAQEMPAHLDVDGIALNKASRRHGMKIAGVSALGVSAVVAVALIGVSVFGGESTSKPRVATGPTSSVAATTTAPVATTTTTAPAPTVRPGTWKALADAPLSPSQTTLWTGTELIIDDSGCCEDAGSAGYAAYNPKTDTWRDLAPLPDGPRLSEGVALVGDEMIVAGGRQDNTSGEKTYPALPTWRYNIKTNEWRQGSAAPASVFGGTWNGSELFMTDANFRNTVPTYAYNPATDEWRKLSVAPIGKRSGTTVVAIGNKIAVWGGNDGSYLGTDKRYTTYNDGVIYDPATDAWAKLPAAPVQARMDATAVWTGSEMVIWGGHDDSNLFGHGAAYNPATNTWRKITSSPLEARTAHLAVWTGSEMLIVGGNATSFYASNGSGEEFSNGAAYDPASDTWRKLVDAPNGRVEMWASAWAGDRAIFFGGSDRDENGRTLNNGSGPQGATLTPLALVP